MTDPSDIPTTRPRRRWGWIVSCFLFLLISGASIVGGGAVMLHRAYTDPGPLSADTNLVIPSGASGRAIAQALTQAGVSADERLVQLSIRLFADKTPLRAGEYAFPAGISLRDAIGKLQSGEVVVRRVTFAEGLSTREILATLSRAEGLRGPVPEASEFSEGELLPETYHYSLGDSRADIVARMKSAMDAAVERLWADRDKDLPLKTPQEAVVLASIIERETAVPEERARVASVFINRLNRGMRLQSDPTVVFGMGTEDGPFTGRLLRRHLEIDHPHNTYTRDGLPPSPIANPGLESIAAALKPAATKYFYFVADGSGGHAFARTLAEHNRNVRKWRQIQRRAQ
ncbi:MAG: endolytic transglycosylase MltG [Alphaproteobacteria bacterium]|jgi:UPF0755 protein